MEEIIARPLITITNIIWSFNPATQQPQILLIKRANSPFKGWWALPETLLRKDESADNACVRLVKAKIGLTVPVSSTEQLATFTNPRRVPGERALALAYMAFLPSMPALRPGYGATAAEWFSLNFTGHRYFLRSARQRLELAEDNYNLAFDHPAIILAAIKRIRNKLDYQPRILQILGPTFTLRQARAVYSPFLQKRVAQIDNSNFKKTHRHLFKELGKAPRPKQTGRPPKLFELADLQSD